MAERRSFRLAVAALFLSVSIGQLSAETSPEAPLLMPGVMHEEQLSSDESHLYRLELAAEGRWWVRIEQLGVDVELVIHGQGLGEPWHIDSPIDWDGTELVLLPSTLSVGRLEVRWLATRLREVHGIGAYRIRLERIEGADADAALRLQALSKMTSAGRAWAAGGGEDRRRALTHYRASVDLWRRLRQPRLAAQSIYAAAVLHRLLGEVAPALELAKRVLPLWRGLADPSREADTLNEIGLLETAASRYDAARGALNEALRAQERTGDLFRQVATSNNLCRTYNKQGRRPEARDCFESALERARAAGDEDSEAVVLHNLGRVEQLLGHPSTAFDRYRQALKLQRAAGRRKRVAEMLNSLAGLHRSVGEQEEALVHYLEALEIFRQVAAGRWEARTLHNLGNAYQALGDPERAVVFYRQALVMRRALGDQAGEAVELRSLGGVDLELGRARTAQDFFNRALDLEQAAGNLAGEGTTWFLLGEASAALGEPESARELFDRAISRLRQLGARPALARALCGKGQSLIALGRAQEASGELVEALDIYRSLGHPRGQVKALHLLAEVHRARGDSRRALALIEDALQRIESVQADLGDADLRATFVGAHRDAFELHIELLIDRRAVPEALEASERARAWGLLELLRQAGHESVGAKSPELADALREARRKLHVLAGQRRRALAQTPLEDASAVEADYLVALAELERVEADVRRTHPEDSELSRPRPPGAAEIRRLLDPSTALVEYFLGRGRGFVFLVTGDSIRVFDLPPRARLEDAVRRLHAELGSPHHATEDGERQANELSRVLLGPVLRALPARVERLAVVADGVLHYLPFGALPLPGRNAAPSTPLIDRWEVVHLPSASALAASRRRRSLREPAPLALAVLADPVFDHRDPRLREAGDPLTTRPTAMPVLRQAEGLELPRLRTSRREAEIIESLARAYGASAEETLVALDFAANRELVLSERLRQYRIVHFATHGVIDARYPALSGLILSLFDADGRPRDGFLRLRDIYGLEFGADLVVLSACSTALGKEVRGEGLVGLTRGFLHAGADQVLASLWPVSDRATAELMEGFYRGRFEEGLEAPAALRRAQLSMMGERRWRDPHNWAGFVLIGDWATANVAAR